MDFYDIRAKTLKKGSIEVYPDFHVGDAKDIMFRGNSFYAIWNEDKKLWSTNVLDVQRLVDNDLKKYADDLKKKHTEDTINVLYLKNYSTGKWKEFCNYAKLAPENSEQLDRVLTFSNSDVKREDYVSKRLKYPLEPGDYSAWDELVGTLYEPSEREKIEWAIGSIIAGDSREIQKFLVFYGEAGSGKSTILHVIEQLFEGYYTTFEAKALASSNNAFATEVFKTNPLVAIQHDGDLSRIEDNSKLNSIISHEDMVLNEKYKSSYTARIDCFLFMATNRPVKITDAKSGIIRRLIDVHPTNEKIPRRRYDELRGRIKFELGAIAWHCLEVYKSLGRTYYDGYRPLDMMYKTDPFYNYVEYNYDIFKEQNGVSLKQAWDLWKMYKDDALIDIKFPMYKFREELKNYFASYKDYARIDDKQFRKYYSGFLLNKFIDSEKADPILTNTWLKFNCETSLFDHFGADFTAQEANDDETPNYAWKNVYTKLRDIDTHKLHYVLVPENHIVIDFDIKDEHGAKSFQQNLEAASKFPPTYAELSKSEAGIHLHYIYEGDVEKLKPIYDKDIEVKVFRGKASLRRKLTKCNDIQIATINSGLPLKEEKETKMIDARSVKSEAKLRELIEENLRKEHWDSTSQSINFIHKILEDAYNSGLTYDVSDMKQAVYEFANHSTNQAARCIDVYSKMHFMSKDHEQKNVVVDLRFRENAPIVFFDVESFPNLFLICWKIIGKGNPIHKMFNPSRSDVYNWIWDEEGKLKYRLIGFNNKSYDNHMIYAATMDSDPHNLFMRSQSLVSNNGHSNAYIYKAKHISDMDVFEYMSEKKSLKRLEIELGEKHHELGLAWDEPVPENLFDKVAEYCCDDVIALEAVYNATKEDRNAHMMLAEAAHMTPNESTNELTGQIVFENDRNPQSQFNYRFMGDIPNDILVLNTDTFEFTEEHNRTAEELISEGKFSVFDKQMRPVFPGYTFDPHVKVHKSQYRGEDPKEGGYVYAEKGMYVNVPVLDIASMHPSSIIAENLFGDVYTKRFKDILDLRLHIKHNEYDEARHMLNGMFEKYLTDPSSGKVLSKVLKIPINAVYGQTSASYPNRFRDPRNIDNIVAKRGALFMINLKYEVQKRGFTVAHIKTDSIKIPNATPEIIDFVIKYGKVYGYNFEHEETYSRFCLVNNAVYIARYDKPHVDKATGKDIWWTATGAQFAHPYVFKMLFSHDPIEFKDLCEIRTVTDAAIYLDMNEDLPDVSALEKEQDALLKKIAKSSVDPMSAETMMLYNRLGEIENEIPKGHNYVFVGKAGQFCPVKKGCGGGLLFRGKNDKYAAISASTGYRWLESEMVQNCHKEKDIDYGYFEKLAENAKNDISKYGDFTWFVSESEPINTKPLDITDDELPF